MGNACCQKEHPELSQEILSQLSLVTPQVAEYKNNNLPSHESKKRGGPIEQKYGNDEIKEKKAVIIQKFWRGYKVRKNKKVTRNSNPLKKQDYFQDSKEPDGMPQTNGMAERIKKGPLKFKSGAIYEGEWKGNQRDGQGVQVWPDGAKYEGQWANNRATGWGKFSHVNGDIFEGEWLEDKACGKGTYKHINGASYTGAWRNDLQHGYGVEMWPDNSKYSGQYADGKKNGHGRYDWSDGSFYEGEWQDNKINGFGEYQWSDGRNYKGFNIFFPQIGQATGKTVTWKAKDIILGRMVVPTMVNI